MAKAISEMTVEELAERYKQYRNKENERKRRYKIKKMQKELQEFFAKFNSKYR